MPDLQVHQLPSQDIYKDIVRVNEAHRLDRHGKPIGEGQVCLIRAKGQRCFAVLRGFQGGDAQHIRMDDYTRHKLGLFRNETYAFEFEPVSFLGQLRWAWNATEVGYQISLRIAVLGFALGIAGLILSLHVPWHLSGPTNQKVEYTGSLIPILSLVVAGLAVFVGPFVSLHIGQKQIELSRRIASKQIVAPMRQAWINDLRDKLAELLSSALHYWNAGYEQRTDEEYKRLGLLEEEINLRINPGEADHKDLVSAIREMLFALERGVDDSDRFSRAYERTNALGQKIFKTEWNRIKDDIHEP